MYHSDRLWKVVKTRLMAAGPDALSALQAEGLRGLARGWLACYLRVGPQTTLLFIFSEQLFRIVQLRSSW